METIFDELVENVLEAVRKFLVAFHVILAITGITLAFTAYHQVATGGLQFGPTDTRAGYVLLSGFIGAYLVLMVLIKVCRLPEIAEGVCLGAPLGIALSFLLLQKMNTPLYVFVDKDTLIAAIALLGLAAWVPYPAAKT